MRMMLDPAEKRGITVSQSIADAVAESIEDAEDYADGVAALERFRKYTVVYSLDDVKGSLESDGIFEPGSTAPKAASIPS